MHAAHEERPCADFHHSQELENTCVSQDPSSAPVIANAASTAVANGAPAKAVSSSLAQVLPFLLCYCT